MKKSVRFWMVSLFLTLMVALAACGGGGAQAPVPAKPKPAASTGGSEASSGGAAMLELAIKGEELAFSKDKLAATAKEGDDITLHFKNTSQTQEHNWVLLNVSVPADAEEFNDAAMSAVDTGYFPEDNSAMTEKVLAHITTKQAGEEETLTFKAPAAGDYVYICTVPGHFAAGDYGILTVKAP